MKYVILWGVVILIFYLLCNISSDKSKKDLEKVEAAAAEPEITLKDKFDAMVVRLSKPYEPMDRTSIQSLEVEIAIFNAYGSIIVDGENSGDQDMIKQCAQLRKKLSSIQVAEYPKLRKAYYEIIKKAMWVENVDVTIKGERMTTLELISYIYADNKAKQVSQETLSKILYILRFKRVNYKFTKYDDEYNYYTLDSPKDDYVSG